MPFSDMKPSDIFKCQQCGDCCKGYGGTFVTDQEIESIAKYINTDSESFVEKYCQMSGDKPVLSQKDNGYCIFWDKKVLKKHRRNFIVLEGDIVKENLGLNRKLMSLLKKEIDEIFHCAAVTKFNWPLNKIRKVNVGGTMQ